MGYSSDVFRENRGGNNVCKDDFIKCNDAFDIHAQYFFK